MTTAVSFQKVSKRFGSFFANDEISFQVEQGTIHGIVGENGAGKSTAMKLLYGMFAPHAGSLSVFGKARVFSSPKDAIALGIGMVHQHFMLARPYSALENIILGWEPACGLPGWEGFQVLLKKKAQKNIQSLMKKYGFSFPLHQPVEQLSVGLQQRIEIVKLLYRKAQILILDEPTAVLTPQEVKVLFQQLKRLKKEGKTILFITHKLEEVMKITDAVTVLRAGKVTGAVKTNDTNEKALARMMVGRDVVLRIEVPPAKTQGTVLLKFENVFLKKKDLSVLSLKDISLRVCGGEIVGIAGVEGNGQKEMIQLLFHPEQYLRSVEWDWKGKIQLFQNALQVYRSASVRALPIGWIPSDRHQEGLLLKHNLSENFLLGMQGLSFFSKYGFLRKKFLLKETKKVIDRYQIRTPSVGVCAEALSGGNQQKLIIAREFYRKPKLLVAAQPTRGVDVGAIEMIHQRIVKVRDQGVGVLLVSSELEEILTLSDRIYVFFQGSIVAHWKREEASLEQIGAAMGGKRWI